MQRDLSASEVIGTFILTKRLNMRPLMACRNATHLHWVVWVPLMYSLWFNMGEVEGEIREMDQGKC